jgi:hypothetical protein
VTERGDFRDNSLLRAFFNNTNSVPTHWELIGNALGDIQKRLSAQGQNTVIPFCNMSILVIFLFVSQIFFWVIIRFSKKHHFLVSLSHCC